MIAAATPASDPVVKLSVATIEKNARAARSTMTTFTNALLTCMVASNFPGSRINESIRLCAGLLPASHPLRSSCDKDMSAASAAETTADKNSNRITVTIDKYGSISNDILLSEH